MSQPMEEPYEPLTTGDPELDAEIDKWVAEQLAIMPEWTEERLVKLGDAAGMNFRHLERREIVEGSE